MDNSNLSAHGLFIYFQFCDVIKHANHPQQELARFYYRLNIFKIKNKESFYILAACNTICQLHVKVGRNIGRVFDYVDDHQLAAYMYLPFTHFKTLTHSQLKVKLEYVQTRVKIGLTLKYTHFNEVCSTKRVAILNFHQPYRGYTCALTFTHGYNLVKDIPTQHGYKGSFGS